MRKFAAVLLPVLVLALGVGVAVFLVKTRPKAKRQPPPPAAPLVEVLRMEPGPQAVTVEAMGTVIPARQVALQAEVSGRVVSQSPHLQPGGLLAAGEVLLRIDDRDYRSAVVQQQGAVAKAEHDLALERGRAAVAEREWGLLGADVAAAGADRDLALRRPQLRMAEAALDAARAGLSRARLSLERCTLTAPFASMVVDEAAELGQQLSPQSRVATLVGVERFWVRVALPVERLGWIRFPGPDGSPGAAAEVEMETGAAPVRRSARVKRLLGELDPAGRLAQVLLEVEDPLQLGLPSEERGLPLLLGAYVRVRIGAEPLQGAYSVPRVALAEGDKVWLADADDRLELRPLDIAWRDEDSVVVRGGLRPGDRLLLSRVARALPGEKVRVAGPAARPVPHEETLLPAAGQAPAAASGPGAAGVAPGAALREQRQ